MNKKIVQTPLMKMLNPLYLFNSKDEEERDFQAIRMYKLEEGSTACKNENLVGTDIFLMEDMIREEETKYENEQKSPINEASKKDELTKPYRRDVEVIRVLERMHTERATKNWKKKLTASDVLANNSRHIKTMEGFSATEYSTADFVDWAHIDTMRNVKTTKNFILTIASKLKTYEDGVSQILFPKINLHKQYSRVSVLSSANQSSKSLLHTPALISGKSLKEKLDKLEKKLKKKEQLRNRIDQGMYNYPKIKRLNSKGNRSSVTSSSMRGSVLAQRSSVVARSSVVSRNSVMSTTSEADSTTGNMDAPNSITPRAPAGNKASGSGPSRKHRRLVDSKSKPGMRSSEDEHSSQLTSLNLSQGNPSLSGQGLAATSIPEEPQTNGAAGKVKMMDQSRNLTEQLKMKNKDLVIEVLPTTQYYSSPDKICKTVTGDVVVVNGNIHDDPMKKYFHPTAKKKEKSEKKSQTKNQSTNYVADIMRIGLSNSEIEEREKSLKLQKHKLGIPKDGYIESIRTKNNKKLFETQKKNLEHRQKLNRRINEFKVVRTDLTKKGIEIIRRKELLRPAHHKQRLEDLSVEDDVWRSRMMSNNEKSMASSFFEDKSLFPSGPGRLHDISHVSDFHHVQPSTVSNVSATDTSIDNNVGSGAGIQSGRITRNDKKFDKRESFNEKDNNDKLLKQKVLEKTTEEMKSAIYTGHSISFQPSCHGDVSPRGGDMAFRENQSRLDNVNDTNEIHLLEKQKWIFTVLELVKGIALKRTKMSEKDRLKAPETPQEVFLFIACLLRLILAGVTIDKEAFYLTMTKFFDQKHHAHPIVLQVVSMVRNIIKVSPQDHYDFLVANDIEVRLRWMNVVHSLLL